MAAKDYQIVLTMNADQVKNYLAKLKEDAKKLREEMDSIKLTGEEDEDVRKANEERFGKMRKDLAKLEEEYKNNADALQSYSDIVENLSGTKLYKLRRALRQVKRDMDRMTEDDAKREELKRDYELITQQIKKMGAEYVSVSKILDNLGKASEKQIRQALAQTNELHASTERGTQEYKDQVVVIEKLEGELARIAAKPAFNVDKVMGNLPGSTQDEIKTTIVELERLRGKTQMGSPEWKNYGDQIKQAKEYLEQFSETAKKMSTKEASAIANEADSAHRTANELREALDVLKKYKDTIKLGDTTSMDEVNAQIDALNSKLGGTVKETLDVKKVLSDLPNATQNQIKATITELERLRGETKMGSPEWDDYGEQIKQAKEYLDKFSETAKKMSTKEASAIANEADSAHRTANELKEALDVLKKYKDTIKMGDTTSMDEVNAQIDALNSKLGGTVKESLDVKKVLSDLPNATQNQIRATITELERLRGETKMGSPEWKDYGDKIKVAKEYLEQFSETAQKMSTKEAETIADEADSANRTTKELKEALDTLRKFRDTLKTGDTAGLKKVDGQIESLNKKLGNTKEDAFDLKKTLANIKSAPIADLKRAAAELEKEIEKIDRKTNREEFEKKREQLDKVKNEIEEMNGHFKKQGNVISQVAKRLSAYVLIYSGFNLVKNKLGEVVQMNLELSDSLADVRKTTGLANDEVESLANNLLKLDTRTTAAELNELAYQAGRMGVGKFGVEGVEGFVRAANKLKVALGEDLGDDSIEQVYKLADVMGVIPTLGVEGSLLAIGSALNELTQTGTSSGTFIVDFTSRMAGIAAQANLTTAEVAGFGSALDEMGQEVEVSATSMNKFVMQMFTHYSLVAKAADMAPETLKEMLEAGETADAIVAVMEGLSKKGGLSMLAPLFKDLGSDGARLSQTLAAMSSNVDKLKSSLNTARDAFNEARSVTNEYNIKNQTTAALLERIKNSWTEMFVNSANNGVIREFVESLKEISDAFQTNHVSLLLLNGSIQVLVFSLKTLIELLPAITTFFAAKGLFVGLQKTFAILKPGVDYLIVGLGKLIGVQRTLRVSTLRLIVAFKQLNGTMKANVYALLASVIIGLAYKMYELATAEDAVYSSFKKIDEGYKQYTKDVIKAKMETDGLFKVLQNENSTKHERAAAIKTLNEGYGQYLPNLLTEKSTLEEIAKAQAAVNTEMQKGMAFRAKQNAMIEVLDPIYEEMADASNVYDKNLRFEMDRPGQLKGYRSYISGYGSEVFKQAAMDLANQGKSESDIFKELLGKAKHASGADGYENETSLSAAKEAMMPYIRVAVQLYQAIKRINEIYDPHIGDWGKKQPSSTNLEEDDKEERDKKDREELAKQKKVYEALMSKIKEYFALQRSAVADMFLKGRISEQTRVGFNEGLNNAENNALMEARRNISGRKNNWDNVKFDIGNISFNESQDALKVLNAIQNVDTSKIHEILKRLGPAEMDAIAKKAAENLVKIKDTSVKVQQEITRILMEDDYLAQVQEKQQAAFERMKLMSLDVVSLWNNLEEQSEESFTRTVQLIWNNAFKYIRENYDKLFNIDILTAEGQEAFHAFLGPLTKEFPQLLNMTEEKTRLLYHQMVKLRYDDEEAKQKAERRDERMMRKGFGKTYFDQTNQSNQNKKESDMRWTDVMGGVGLSTEGVMADHEIELYRLKLEEAQMYYEYVLTQAKEKATIDKAQQELDQATMALTEKLVEKVGTQLAYLKQYGDAVADFGTDFGAAVFGSLEDRQKSVENLAKAFGETTKKILLDWVRQRLMQKLNDKLMEMEQKRHEKKMKQETEQGGETRLKVQDTFQQAGADIAKKGGEEISNVQKKQNAEDVQDNAKAAQANTSLSVAEGSAKTIAKLGWWGIPLVAVIEALLNGLLSMAMSKVSSLFGGGNKAQMAMQKTKVVSGMLTYDGGNVQEMARYIGDDGILYTVTKNVAKLQTGMVNEPIATMVNGQPSLVGERGPEMVIGRETTAAMMLSRPDLLREIIRFDKHRGGYRTYDAGNVSDLADAVAPGDENSAQLLATLQELSAVNAALAVQLQKGINARINKYGPGGLAEEVADALLFEANHGNNPQLRRLLNRKN